MTTAHTYTIDDLRTYAKRQLQWAQRDFNKSPTSVRWTMTLNAMFVYQQVDVAMRSPRIDQAALLDSLDGKPYGEWDDLISIATTGRKVRDVLAYTA
jgi:tRNA A37 N6-isopentenylltransferase MiaA